MGGTASSDVIREEFEQADVVLAIGLEFAETDYDYYFEGDIQIGGELIRIDIDPEQANAQCAPKYSGVQRCQWPCKRSYNPWWPWAKALG